ncbi:Plastocyanin [Frankineae bacterium MT45]|nr:Plastocyanin [Frankineae bacterium MT45]
MAGILTACGSSATQSSPAPATSSTSAASTTGAASPSASSTASTMPASAAMITIKNFGFTVTGDITPGEKVMVHNEDNEAHTVTADSGGAFDVNVPASSMATLTAPAKAGTYKFHCSYHSEMHGTLTVK